MAKITFEMVKQAYNIAKKYCNKKIDRCKGINILHDDYKMNEGMAAIFINNFRCLINGQEYKRIMSIEQTQYFLEQIFNDYEEEIFKNALYSVKKHIEYIKSKKNYSNVEKLYKDIIREHDIKDEKLVNISIKINEHNNKVEQKSKNKPKSAILTKKPLSESSYEIAQRVKKIILKINEIYKINRKKPIFNESIKLWGNIEKSCVSRDDFKIFSETLYNLFDKTRYKNPTYSRNNGEPFYISMLPKDFTQDNPTTTHFIFIVNTLRHYYVHEETDKIVDVYEDLLGNRFGPDSSEDYEKQQIGVLKLFEDSMEKLLEMVKDDLNRPQTH